MPSGCMKWNKCHHRIKCPNGQIKVLKWSFSHLSLSFFIFLFFYLKNNNRKKKHEKSTSMEAIVKPAKFFFFFLGGFWDLVEKRGLSHDIFRGGASEAHLTSYGAFGYCSECRIGGLEQERIRLAMWKFDQHVVFISVSVMLWWCLWYVWWMMCLSFPCQ